MGGVHLLLRDLVDERDPAVFSLQFALTNAVKCARATDRMATGVTSSMIGNCAAHLKQEIEILSPTLIITQGGHPSWTVKSLLGIKEPIATFKGDGRGMAEVFHVGDRILLTTPHPARLKGLKWRQGILPSFLREAVAFVRQEFK